METIAARKLTQRAVANLEMVCDGWRDRWYDGWRAAQLSSVGTHEIRPENEHEIVQSILNSCVYQKLKIIKNLKAKTNSLKERIELQGGPKD